MGIFTNLDPDQAASPQVTVTIYPYEVDTALRFSTTALQSVLDLTVSQSINQASTFTMTLAPEDLSSILSKIPTSSLSNGPNDLASLITPMSLIIITASRGSQTNVPIFFGIVTEISESKTFTPDVAQRMIQLQGVDMSYYLRNFAYYTLTFLGAISGLLLNLGGTAGVLTNQLGSAQETPVTAATKFMNLVVMPYLQYTTFNVAGKQSNWGQLVQLAFGELPAVQTPQFQFPFLVDFLTTEGGWLEKFDTFFPAPVYEMFIMNYPLQVNANQTNTQPTAATAGIPATTPVSGQVPVSLEGNVQPVFVSRPAPYPHLTANAGTLSLDRAAWDSLIEYGFNQTNPIIQANIGFSTEEARSFYALNPRMYTTLFGTPNAASTSWLLSGNQATIAMDPIALSKFGYKPYFFTTDWFADLNGIATGSNLATTTAAVYENLLLYVSSYFVPITLMAKGTVKFPFSPWVLPGNKISLQPFKNTNGGLWTFYIEKVDHCYDFGGESYTLLTLSRGLPKEIYNDNGLLMSLLQGLVERANNTYQLITNPTIAGNTGLTLVNPGNANKVYASILPGYSSAQPNP